MLSLNFYQIVHNFFRSFSNSKIFILTKLLRTSELLNMVLNVYQFSSHILVTASINWQSYQTIWWPAILNHFLLSVLLIHIKNRHFWNLHLACSCAFQFCYWNHCLSFSGDKVNLSEVKIISGNIRCGERTCSMQTGTMGWRWRQIMGWWSVCRSQTNLRHKRRSHKLNPEWVW